MSIGWNTELSEESRKEVKLARDQVIEGGGRGAGTGASANVCLDGEAVGVREPDAVDNGR